MGAFAKELLSLSSLDTKKLFPFFIKDDEGKDKYVLYFSRRTTADVMAERERFSGDAFKDISGVVLHIVNYAKDQNGAPLFGIEDIANLNNLPANLILEIYTFALNPSGLGTVPEIKK